MTQEIEEIVKKVKEKPLGEDIDVFIERIIKKALNLQLQKVQEEIDKWMKEYGHYDSIAHQELKEILNKFRGEENDITNKNTAA